MVPEISVHELKQRLATGAPTRLLDVRQAWEHDLVALPGSQLVPLPELPARTAEIAPLADALLVVYCHHGVRSLSAAHFLLGAGHPAVVSLAGGIDAWAREIDPSLGRY